MESTACLLYFIYSISLDTKKNGKSLIFSYAFCKKIYLKLNLKKNYIQEMFVFAFLLLYTHIFGLKDIMTDICILFDLILPTTLLCKKCGDCFLILILLMRATHLMSLN